MKEEMWRDDAACREAKDPDAFYAKTADFEGALRERRLQWDDKMDYAKSFCHQCKVRTECLVSAFDFFVENGEVRGVSAGLVEREQRKLFRDEKARRVRNRRAQHRAAS